MAESDRLFADATAAFVDRAPIDWPALLARVHADHDRALFENLHALAAVRDAVAAPALHAPRRGASLAAWMVVAIGAVETAAFLTLMVVAAATGHAGEIRPWQSIIALTFTACSLPLGLATFRDPNSLFLLATFASIGSIFSRSAANGLTAMWSGPVQRLLDAVLLDPFVPACLWQFALGFPRVVRFTRFDRRARDAVFVSWLLGLCLFGATLVTGGHAIDGTLLEWLARDHSSRYFWRLFSLSLAAALAVIAVRAGRAPASERRRVARLVLAIAIGLGPFLILSIARIAVPAVDDWFKATIASGSRWPYDLILTALAAMPVLTTAAVLVDRPFELQAAPSLRARLRTRLPHSAWRRGAHRDRRTAGALLRLTRARGPRETLAALGRELRAGLDRPIVHMLIRERDGVLRDGNDRRLSLDTGSGIVALLDKSAEPLDFCSDLELVHLLPHEDREWLTAHAVQVLAGWKRDDGEIACVVALGANADRLPFDRRDAYFVLALLAAARTAFEPDSSASDDVAFECPACGIVATSRAMPCSCDAGAVLGAIPQSVAGKFTVERRVGSGAMGIVYLARDVTVDRDVALKTLPRMRPEAVRRLRDEARAMAALNHESLATLYGLEFWRGTPVLVVEYFPNGTLARRLRTGPLSPTDAVALAIRLAQALVYMHDRGVLHRDLKPSNIGFTADGSPKLLDFGLATASTTTGTHKQFDRASAIEDQWAGTPAYLPPEAFEGAASSAASDRWALAVVLLEAASGATPHEAMREWAARGRLVPFEMPAVCARTLTTAPSLRAFLERALSRQPIDRFQTSREFLLGLEKVAERLS